MIVFLIENNGMYRYVLAYVVTGQIKQEICIRTPVGQILFCQ